MKKIGNMKLVMTIKTPKTIKEVYGQKGQLIVTRPSR